MKRVLSPVLFISLLGLSTLAQAATSHYVITIPEMHCEGCSAAVVGTLAKRPEVASAEADIEHHVVHLTLKPHATLSEKKIRALVNASGFTPTEIKAQD